MHLRMSTRASVTVSRESQADAFAISHVRSVATLNSFVTYDCTSPAQLRADLRGCGHSIVAACVCDRPRSHERYFVGFSGVANYFIVVLVLKP